MRKYSNDKSTFVSRLEVSGDEQKLAVGYSDGEILLYSLPADFGLSECVEDKNEVKIALNEHKAQISAMQFGSNDTVLYSASYDTHIIVWDLISETSLYKLKGHKN